MDDLVDIRQGLGSPDFEQCLGDGPVRLVSRLY